MFFFLFDFFIIITLIVAVIDMYYSRISSLSIRLATQKKKLTKFPLLRPKRRRSNILSTTTFLVAAAGAVVGALRSSSKKFITKWIPFIASGFGSFVVDVLSDGGPVDLFLCVSE